MGDIISLPFAALLRWMYALTGSYGLSIILFAVVVKLVLLPFQMKSKRNMVRMGRLSGKQQELQKQYANNQQKYQEELSKLYQDEGVNPMGGCLWFTAPSPTSCAWAMRVWRPCVKWRSISVMTAESTALLTSRSV